MINLLDDEDSEGEWMKTPQIEDATEMAARGAKILAREEEIAEREAAERKITARERERTEYTDRQHQATGMHGERKLEEDILGSRPSGATQSLPMNSRQAFARPTIVSRSLEVT